MGVLGFPIKMSKAEAGLHVRWIGAYISSLKPQRAIQVTIPEEKSKELLITCSTFRHRQVIGKKQLRSLAGSLSFVAGIVPQMRPFLAGLWAVLGDANDTGKPGGKLIHTKRIAHALDWIIAVLHKFATKTVRAIRPNSKAMVITDASTFGLGAVLFFDGVPRDYFSCPIPSVFIHKFKANTGDPKHMALWESLCLLLAARVWLVLFPLGSVVKVKADNIAALYLISKGRAKSPDLAVVAREFAYDQALEFYEFTLIQHIGTKLNSLADTLSRLHDPKPSVFPEDRLRGCTRVPISVDDSFWRVTGYDQPSKRGKQ